MEGPIIVILFVIVLVLITINITAASRMQEIAELKGSKDRFWAWCFWTPIIGYMMVIALPDLVLREKLDCGSTNQSETSDSTTEKDELPDL